ncbi:unnamed protein product, partial [Mesorhabditis belari]|uniref:Uncharacterized protein n=1 Tax=Mesorhabditis belari TaxID=2138241 RepID=A0AAF3EHQ8_9BILA
MEFFVFGLDNSVGESTFVWPDLTCLSDVHCAVFYGSDPGLLSSKTRALSFDEHLFRSLIFECGIPFVFRYFPSRSSVTTLYATECSYVVDFSSCTDSPETSFNYLDMVSFLTSYNYPWIFDDPTKFDHCQTFQPTFSIFTSKTERLVSFELIQIENGFLQVFAGHDPNLNDPPNCALAVTFCPLDHPQNARFGFVAKLGMAPVEPPENVTCLRTITLTKDEPQAVFGGGSVLEAESLFGKVCNVSKSPLPINGRYPEIGQWNARFYTDNSSSILTTQFIADGFIYLNDASDLVILFIDGYTNMKYRVEKSNRPTWIIAAFNIFEFRKLRKIREDRTSNPCEYKIYAGPPSGTENHPQRLLNTYSDNDPFLEQYLLSDLYSILVPPGCAPSLAVDFKFCKNNWRHIFLHK